MTNMSTEVDPGSRAVVRDKKIFFCWARSFENSLAQKISHLVTKS